METENPLLLAMGIIIGTVILFGAHGLDNPILYMVSFIIYGMGVGGVFWNKWEDRNREKEYARQETEKNKSVNRLRREFRGTRLNAIVPMTAEGVKGYRSQPGFGDGIYGDSKELI